MSSATCAGSDSVGSLYISETEMKMRCGNDPQCAGYLLWTASAPAFYRPVTNIAYIVSSDTKWETFRKC